MGDRGVVWIEGASAAIYVHWNGHELPDWIDEAKPSLCSGDPDYATARLIGFMHNKIEGNTSLGVLPPPKDGKVTERYSHGDAGVVVLDAETFEARYLFGYLRDDPRTQE